MTCAFTVDVVEFSKIEEMPGAWTVSDYSALLDVMEFCDYSNMGSEDLREICLMALQDLAPAEAAYLVLKYVIGDALKDSQLHNMSHEMPTKHLWEDYVDPGFHARLFRVGSLLYAAMPTEFPRPDAAQVAINVTAREAEAMRLLAPTPDKALLLRLLADGMDESALLRRLFDAQLRSQSFPDAAHIIWNAKAHLVTELGCAITVVGAASWFDPLQQTQSYQSNAHADSGEAEPVPA